MSQQGEIRDAIAEYARAYARLEALQGPSSLLPRGDQKTGCIGEFYARLYLHGVQPTASVTPGHHSNKTWDFEVKAGDSTRWIQVKTVSAYSRTRVLSPIHRGWHELWVISLDSAFQPDGFWIVADQGLDPSLFPLRGVRVPRTEHSSRSAGPLAFGSNRISEFRSHVQGAA
jgi:hypothetical protein